MGFSWQEIGIAVAVLAAMIYLGIFWIRNSRTKSSGCSNCNCSKRPDHINQ